jgi:hypothetical protein
MQRLRPFGYQARSLRDVHMEYRIDGINYLRYRANFKIGLKMSDKIDICNDLTE